MDSERKTRSHIAEPVAKKIAPLLRTGVLTFGRLDVAEGKWTLAGGIEIPCKYIFYGKKKKVSAS